MAYTTIDKSSLHFNTKLYAGTGSAGNAQTGINFQPDFVWLKNTDNGTGSHGLFDAVRGVSKRIKSDDTVVEATYAGVSSFDSDGFTLGTSWNQSSTNFVSWNWKANGAGSANTDGSINTTATSANTTAGFSIVKYTGTGSNATIGHGLGVAPKMIIVKNLTDARSWGVYHASLGATQGIDLDGTGAAGSASTYWNNTAPTTSVFSIGTANNTGAAQTYVAYCFAEKTGFSKFMGWSGNGETDGTFLYTGFKPAFFMYKVATGTTGGWGMLDNKRDTINPVDNTLSANSNSAQADDHDVDFLSNGLKIRSAGGNINMSGATYIGMAFAEAPLVGSNNVPCTAR